MQKRKYRMIIDSVSGQKKSEIENVLWLQEQLTLINKDNCIQYYAIFSNSIFGLEDRIPQLIENMINVISIRKNVAKCFAKILFHLYTVNSMKKQAQSTQFPNSQKCSYQIALESELWKHFQNVRRPINQTYFRLGKAPTFSLIYHCLNVGLLKNADFMFQCREYSDNEPDKEYTFPPEFFLYFMEIFFNEEHSYFQYQLNMYKKYFSDFNGKISEVFSTLFADNFEKLRYCIKHTDMPDSLRVTLIEDDIDKFIQNYSETTTIDADICATVYDPYVRDSIKIMNFLAMYGSVKIFRYLLMNYKGEFDAMKGDILSYAIRGGNLEIFKLCEVREIKVEHTIAAITSYRKDILDYLMNKHSSELEDFLKAASSNNIYFLKIYMNENPLFIDQIIQEASKRYSSDFLSVFLEFITTPNPILMVNCAWLACENNAFNALELLMKKDPRILAYDGGNELIYKAILCSSNACVDILLTSPDIDININLPKYRNLTPLQMAASCNNSHALKAIITRPELDKENYRNYCLDFPMTKKCFKLYVSVFGYNKRYFDHDDDLEDEYGYEYM